MHMLGAKYAIEVAKKSAMKPKNLGKTQPIKKKNEVKSKFKELLDEKRKKQCNYEEVHALYKTTKKARPSSANTDELPEKKPPVPRFSKDNFFISRPAIPMVEQFYEKYIKDDSIIEKGLADGKFV